MEAYPPARIRNVALVGHSGSGKTTLAEALLHDAGVLNRPGRVEDGSTVSDHEPEEVKRGISISLALAPFEVDCQMAGRPARHKINLLDTPGYADFVGDAEAALAVADLAVVVVSGVDGVEVQTEEVWHLCAELGLPRLVFVNKLDRERASFDRTVADLRTVFGTGVAPLELPIGTEGDFDGVVDLLTGTATRYAAGRPSPAETPEPMAAAVASGRDTLVEGLVVGDDALLERYLEGEVPGPDELSQVLAQSVASAAVFPVVCGSATLAVGVDRLARAVCLLGPTPESRPPVRVRAGDGTTEVSPDPAGQPLATVFKTLADPYLGHISLFRVLSGTIRPDDHVVNPRTGADERLHALFTLRGKTQVEVSELPAGDIGAVAKLGDTRTGDTLAPRGTPVVVPSRPVAEPVLAMAVRPRTQGDDDKLATALHRLQEEDPALVVQRDQETHQTLLRGRGDTHLGITLERLERKFGVEVDTEDVLVPYRETISAQAEAEGKYKKQSGGHGQFGVAFLRVEPGARGSGFVFDDAIVGGAIPRQFIPAVEKGVMEAMEQGGVHGYPVVDVKVTCFDGKYHSVDSSEMSFKMAGSLGFRDAVARAGPVVLEPISLLEVDVPDELLGDVMGDLNARRGRVQGSEPTEGRRQKVQALAPTAEILRYAIDLRSITGGRGRFSARHDHYDVLPGHLVDRLVPAGT